MKKSILYICLILFLALFFITNPQIDVFFSRQFYSINFEHFLCSHQFICLVIDKFLYLLLLYRYISVLIFYFINIKVFRYKNRFLFFNLGSTVIVQVLLKNFFGRSRPESIVEFGGIRNFSSAFIISDECFLNCSFISFHVAVATIFFFDVGDFFRKKNLIFQFVVGFLCIMLYSTIKIFQGKHFLSDIVVSICFIFIIDSILRIWIIKKRDC